jgi:UDP-N-acetylglucosamine transferase subunit ALG13
MTLNKKGTFITIGNAKQSFRRLLDCCIQLREILPRPIIVQYGNTKFFHPDFECHEFINAELFIHTMRSSKIVIAHAGAGSILNSIRAGTKPIVMARMQENQEHINNHQLDLGLRLNQDGYVYLVSNLSEMQGAVFQALKSNDCDLIVKNSEIFNYIESSLEVMDSLGRKDVKSI